MTAAGFPIALAPVNDVGGLVVVEGVECGLSVRDALGVGVWASGSSSRIPALAAAVPRYVEAVTVFAHPDALRQAEKLASALRRCTLEVRLKPETDHG